MVYNHHPSTVEESSGHNFYLFWLIQGEHYRSTTKSILSTRTRHDTLRSHARSHNRWRIDGSWEDEVSAAATIHEKTGQTLREQRAPEDQVPRSPFQFTIIILNWNYCCDTRIHPTSHSKIQPPPYDPAIPSAAKPTHTLTPGGDCTSLSGKLIRIRYRAVAAPQDTAITFPNAFSTNTRGGTHTWSGRKSSG